MLQNLYSSAPVQGAVWYSQLAQAPDGNLYGTAPSSSSTKGSVFRLTPAGVLTTVVTFTGFAGSGSDPEGGLVVASDGNLYGTTAGGGAFGGGTLFKLTTNRQYQVLYSFTGSSNLATPQFTMVQANDGFLYGVTPGAVFRATTGGSVITLTNFPSSPTRFASSDGLVAGPDGWLYGTTIASILGSPTMCGAIYKVATNGAFKTLHSFPVSPGSFEGNCAIAGLTPGPDGQLYGTIGYSGSGLSTNNGQVFRMTTDGVITILFTFGGTNGANPRSRLVLASDGNFYGTTSSGGPSNRGTVFRFTTNGVLTTLAGGFGPVGIVAAPALMPASDGNLYGTGVSAGITGTSLIFRLVPPPALTAGVVVNNRLTLTWSAFSNGTYTVSYRSAKATIWTTLVSGVLATGTSCTASDWPGDDQRFYRVALLP